MPHLWFQAPRACHERLDTGPFLRAYSASPPYFAPLTKPRQPLCGRISGLVGAFSPFFSIAKPLRGCLRGRSGRARGPQATGGPGGGTPRRARSALGAGRVGQGGTVRPPLGGTIEGRGSREAGEPLWGAPCRQARQQRTNLARRLSTGRPGFKSFKSFNTVLAEKSGFFSF